jgi:hypothetical protein
MSRASAEKIQGVLLQEQEEEREKEKRKAGSSTGGGRGRPRGGRVGALSRGETNVKTRRGSKVDSDRGSVAGSVAGDLDSDAEVMEVENSVHTPKRGGEEGTGGGVDGREQGEGALRSRTIVRGRRGHRP